MIICTADPNGSNQLDLPRASILKRLPSNGKVSIEAAHIYCDQDLDLRELRRELTLASVIAWDTTKLINRETSAEAEKILFVDDLSPERTKLLLNNQIIEPPVLFIHKLKKYLSASGFSPDKVILESEQIPTARILLEKLIEKDKVKSNRSGKLMLKSGWIPLTGKSGNLNCPSCSLLDAALYQSKLTACDVTITILPEKYKSQQNQVRAILAELGFVKPKIIVIYFSLQTLTVNYVDYWGN